MVAGDEARQSEPALITTKLSHRHDGQATVLRGRLLTHLSQLLTELPEGDKRTVIELYRLLERRLADRR